MLRIWDTDKDYFRTAVYLRLDFPWSGPIYNFMRFDPVLRAIRSSYYKCVPMNPLAVSGLFDGSYHDDARIIDLSTKPINSKLRDNLSYDARHYGSFTDPLQEFWSILNGKLDSAPPAKIASQHFVRHRSFKGEASSGITEVPNYLFEDVDITNYFGVNIPVKYYPSTRFRIAILGNSPDDIDWTYGSGDADFVDLGPFFDFLQSRSSYQCSNVFEGVLFESTIRNFTYTCDTKLSFSYDVTTREDYEGEIYNFSYHVYYRGGELQTLYELSNPRRVVLGHPPAVYGVTGYQSDHPDWTAFSNFEYTNHEPLEVRIIGVPGLHGSADSISGYALKNRLFEIAEPFWDSVDLNLFDITALSRDTATVALNRLSSQGFSPTVGRIGAINPLKSLGDSLLAKAGDAALGDFFRMTWKKILGLGGGAGLVRYRTVFSDALQLINALEVLGSLRGEPSRLYSASADYDYPVVLGGRDCVVRVRSKAYLYLSPFGLLQILIGRQSMIILNDLLALYYTSVPFGEILLTLLQLRRIGDYISTRMFYELPLFFVHSYLVETQLSQAEMDYTGISSHSGEPVKVTYYIRDVSEYLPVLRFSNLTPFYGTGDVGNITWSLLQQLVGVLSSSV